MAVGSRAVLPSNTFAFNTSDLAGVSGHWLICMSRVPVLFLGVSVGECVGVGCVDGTCLCVYPCACCGKGVLGVSVWPQQLCPGYHSAEGWLLASPVTSVTYNTMVQLVSSG